MTRYFLFILILLFCLGCKRQPGKIAITISLTDSNRSVSVKGFDKAVIGDIGRDTDKSVWQGLLPVYKMPADTDLKDFQTAQPGMYMVKDSVVIFKPDTPFKKGQAYFLRYYPHDEGTDAWQYIRDRKRTGSQEHRDLIFKY